METEIEVRISTLNIEMLSTLASLGEFVVAQNAALIELARLVSQDRKDRGDFGAIQDLAATLDTVKKESHNYVKTLRISVDNIKKRTESLRDA